MEDKRVVFLGFECCLREEAIGMGVVDFCRVNSDVWDRVVGEDWVVVVD